MKLIFVSDTHNLHGQTTQAIIAARADVLVHCGDATGIGKIAEVGDFGDWCEMLLRKNYVQHVVMVAGNHDLLFDHGHKLVRTDWTRGPARPVARA